MLAVQRTVIGVEGDQLRLHDHAPVAVVQRGGRGEVILVVERVGQVAGRPTLQEILAKLRAHGRSKSQVSSAAYIRAMRDAS